jgi:hypothetical protein
MFSFHFVSLLCCIFYIMKREPLGALYGPLRPLLLFLLNRFLTLTWLRPSFLRPVRAALSLIRSGRTSASNDTAVRPSVGGLTDLLSPIRGVGQDSGALSVNKKTESQSQLSTPHPAQRRVL